MLRATSLAALAVICTFAGGSQAWAQGASFGSCDGRIWISQADTLYSVGTATNPFSYTPAGKSAFNINAGDFNPADFYIYGMVGGGNHLFKMGTNGVAVDQGSVAGLPSTTYISGGFNAAGTRLFLVNNTPNTNQLYSVNIANRTATTITLSRSVSIADIAWVDGFLYSIEQTGQMIRVNVSNGTVTNIGTPNGKTNGVHVGGIVGAPNGLFGIANNGGFYQFSVTTGAATQLSDAAASNSNDAYHCPAAPLAFGADLAITKTNTPASGSTDLPNDLYAPGSRTYTIVARNNGPFGAQAQIVNDILPPGITSASWTCTGGNGGECGAASGTGTINNVGVDLPVGGFVTFLLTMDVPASVTGDLVNIATITASNTVIDANTTNNSATDSDQAAPLVMIRKQTIGGTGAFTFSGTNGLNNQTLTTMAADTPVAGAWQAMANLATSTTITETVPAPYRLTDISCTGLPGGGTFTPDINAGTVTLNAPAAAVDARITCTFTNTKRPAIRLSKVWRNARSGDSATLNVTGGAAPASFTALATAPAETLTSPETLLDLGDALTLSETLNAANSASYNAGAWSCSGGGSLAGNILTVGANEAGAVITCSITNTGQLADLSVVKTATPVAVRAGEITNFTIAVTNNGPDDANNAVLSDTADASLDCFDPLPIANCVGSNGAVCPSTTVAISSLMGSGITIPTFPVGGQLRLTMQCRVNATGLP